MQITKSLFLPFFMYVSYGVAQIGVSEYEQMLIDHVKWSIDQANRSISKLTPPVLAIHGMTGYPVKHFLNNICSLEGATYLEIGVWKGATFTAALFQNQTLAQAVAIDNWSEFGGPASDFQKNCQLISNIPFTFYNADCFTLSLKEIFKAPVDIYFYDGEHTFSSQERAFTYYDQVLAPTFIAIVDDWNHKPAKDGTRSAFKKLGYTILFEQELPGQHTLTTWWNGLYVAVIRK